MNMFSKSDAAIQTFLCLAKSDSLVFHLYILFGLTIGKSLKKKMNCVLQVTDWPKEDHGKFFDGDSYIILNTYKDKESDEV